MRTAPRARGSCTSRARGSRAPRRPSSAVFDAASVARTTGHRRWHRSRRPRRGDEAAPSRVGERRSISASRMTAVDGRRCASGDHERPPASRCRPAPREPARARSRASMTRQRLLHDRDREGTASFSKASRYSRRAWARHGPAARLRASTKCARPKRGLRSSARATHATTLPFVARPERAPRPSAGRTARAG